MFDFCVDGKILVVILMVCAGFHLKRVHLCHVFVVSDCPQWNFHLKLYLESTKNIAVPNSRVDPQNN